MVIIPTCLRKNKVSSMCMGSKASTKVNNKILIRGNMLTEWKVNARIPLTIYENLRN